MTLKTKLISTVIALIMVASLMLVGIFANPTITMQMGGNVSFTANGVYAEVTGTITGASGGQVTLPKVEIDYTDTTENITMPSEWTNMPLTFDENGSEITVSFTITNLATDRNIDTTITDTTVTNGFTVTRDCDGETISETDNRIITDSATYTFKLNVSSKNSPASGTFGINVHLENTTEEPQEGYTVTIECVLETEEQIRMALNRVEEFLYPSSIENAQYEDIDDSHFSHWKLTIPYITQIAFANAWGQFRAVGFPSDVTITSDTGINESKHFTGMPTTEYFGWYEITQDTTFNIVVTSGY